MTKGTSQQRSRTRAIPLDGASAARIPERLGRIRHAARKLMPVVLSLLVAAAGLLSDSGTVWATKGGFPGAIRSHGVPLSMDPRATPQWRDTLKRQADSDRRTCPAAKRKLCVLVGWGGFLDGLAGEPRRAQIKAVNFAVNQVRYREDSEAWGTYDYWATPQEFFGQGGDCEDYAIAKYLALRALGIAAAQLFVMVVKDELGGAMHAVLLVDAPDGAVVLDNRSDLIVLWRDFLSYKPVYWVNEDAGWIALARK